MRSGSTRSSGGSGGVPMRSSRTSSRPLNGRPFPLIINGDAIEGNHHRSKELLHVDEVEHARAAIHTLEFFTEMADSVYVVEGTECHTKGWESYIGRELGAVRTPSGRYSWPQLLIEIHGSLGSIQHHMPTTGRPHLEASAMSIMTVVGQTESRWARHRVPQWFAGAHRHKKGMWTNWDAMWMVTPAWQTLTRHARKVVPFGKVSPGVLWLDWAGVEVGEVPNVRCFFRRPDQPHVEEQ